MAAEVVIGGVVGAGFGEVVSKLSDAIIYVSKKTWYFKSKLNELKEIISDIKPLFDDIEKLNEKLDRRRRETDRFTNLLQGAEELVLKCEHIEGNRYKRYRHALKLDNLNASLLRFCQIDVVLQLIRDVKETLLEVRQGSESGCPTDVPLLKGIVIGFDDRVRTLKTKVLYDSVVDDCSVILVSAAGGFGKTTLVTMLCHDPDIKEKFGENIYFVTISSNPNLKAVMKGLLKRNNLEFNSGDNTTRQWGSFLNNNQSPVLLVLDDVWSHSIVEDFKFKLSGYKILVTSRTTFTQVNNRYELELLSHKDATDLFRLSAYSEQLTDVTDELVKQFVECCKNHPLALTVMGGMLKGTPMASWETLSNQLSEGIKSIWDSEDFMLLFLEKSLDLFNEPEIKKCFLDLGLFPDDQKTAATALKDMWVHLYKHDEKGSATLDMLSKLSNKNLATLLPLRKNSPANDDRCEEEFVMQHDMLRTLAIRLSSQGSEKHRERLIINPNEVLRLSVRKVNARLLSITTDVISPSGWESIKVPKVEVFVLNFMSKIHPLPKFMKNMKRLKVLIITNYGYYFSELENFPAPKNLSSLTSLRLDRVSVSSISISILKLVNLQKLSLIMCKIGNSFNEESVGIYNKLTNILEIDIESCDDLVTFPATLCNLASLRKLSITNCHELISLSEGFGNLTNLEVLRLASCSKLAEIPESIRNLKKLSIIDISYCLSLSKLPVHIGELGSLQTIDVRSCTGLYELPESVKDLQLKVVCNEEISHRWSHLKDVELKLVEEDRLRSLSMIMPRR